MISELDPNLSVEVQLHAILDDYLAGLDKTVKKVTKKHARTLRETIMNDSPIDTTSGGKVEHGVYKNGWRVSTTESLYYIDCTVRQYRRPSLTWLLENGHLLQDGTMTKPQPHIEDNGEAEGDRWLEELYNIGFIDMEFNL